tara:strand:- start:1711 stop:2073 length:363 start_codon:yes stop_codon:yes gene_type:complete
MKSWKKENKILVNVFYSEYDLNAEKYIGKNIEGQRIYLNFPDAVDFVTVLTKEQEIVSIASKLIDRIVYGHVPKEYFLTESLSVDSAKLRMKMLKLDLDAQKERLEQDEALDNIKDIGSV